jgi:Fe-S-cluster-containing dehydrogenase component
MSSTDVDRSRREFLRRASIAIAAAAISTQLPVTITIQASAEAVKKRRRWAMFIDISKCYGCMACVVACAAENNVPIGVFRTWVERHVLPDGSMIFIPKQCNHCDNPPCVKPCPTGATYRTEDGLVLVDARKCIGCGACIVSCPYGARYFNPVTGAADKCTFCAHRIYQGRLPACVEACPTRARIFGDLNDENSEVRKMVSGASTQVLKPETGAKPQIFYRDLPEVASR